MSVRAQSKVPSQRSFAARIQDLLEHVEYRRVETAADLDAILRLRYEAYLKEGAVARSESGRLRDAFDDVDNVYNFGVFIDGQLASALRLHCLYSIRQRSPAIETFSDFVAPQLQASKLILDPNRFVADYDLARLYPGLPYVTLRVGILACVHFGIDLATITVRAEHQAFYKRAFFAYEVCPPRPYPLLSKPISLLFLDFLRDADRIFERHPYWASSLSERQALFDDGPTSISVRRERIGPSAATLGGLIAPKPGPRAPSVVSPPSAAAR